jgi:transposase
MEMSQYLKARYRKLLPRLDERSRRLVAAADCATLGRGGISQVARAAGLSRPTLYQGVRELEGKAPSVGRIRRPGGGRKSAEEKYPRLGSVLEELVEPATRGDPMRPLRWTTKSTRKLAEALAGKGIQVSHRVVAEMLSKLDYSLQANAKSLEEGSNHEDRDAQFEHINQEVREFMRRGEPVISVDTKKKELVGRYKNGGREWHPQGRAPQVKVHDFIDKELGKAIPYGIYDVTQNQGWVNVGRDHDTAAFAVESIRRWWRGLGRQTYPQAKRLLICADGGGSNGYRVRLWKKELQGLADETGVEMQVCHLPPGTSKWNKIEHRLFSHISINWRGKPLISHEVIIQLIAGTTTKSGLRVTAQSDPGKYPDKLKVTDEEMESLNLIKAEFHGEWNYVLKPRVM